MADQAESVAYSRELQAHFASSDQMQDAVTRLSLSGFDRAALSVPASPRDDAAPESASQPAFTEEDARQMRTLGASTAAAAAAIAAAGITVATGGAAIPVAAAAVVAGGAAGGATFAVQGAANETMQRDRNAKAASGSLILTVRTMTDIQHAEAEGILRATGATSIETVQ